MKELQKLALKIKEVTGVDIFKNSRNVECVEARSLFNYIAYNTYKVTLSNIARFYEENGKNSDHASIHYSLKNFKLYEQNSYLMQEWIKEMGLVNKQSKKHFAQFYLLNLNPGNLEKAYFYLKDIYQEQE